MSRKKQSEASSTRPAGSRCRCIIKRPDELYGHVTNISTTLENLQKTVEGPIEVVRLPGGTDVMVHSKAGGEPNFGPYCGTVVVLGTDGADFCDAVMGWKTWKWLMDLRR